MNLMEQILERMRQMSDEEFAQVVSDSVDEYLQRLEEYEDMPNFLSDEENEMLNKIFTSNSGE